MALHTIDICAGTGMLGEGLRAGLRHLGGETRTACYIEREAYAASLLVARMQDGSLDDAPIWADLTTFDARAWHGAVDCVVAGFPCQDLSVAGQRAGLDGKRSGLFFDILKIATDCGAQWMFLENVAGIASATATAVDEGQDIDERAASRVVGALADSGWNAEWLTLRASAVGASHRRDRWFCLAWRRGPGNAQGDRSIGQADKLRGATALECASQQLAYPQRGSLKRQRDPSVVARTSRESQNNDRGQQRIALDCGCGAVANTSDPRLQGREQLGALPCSWHGQQAHGSTTQLRRPLFALGPDDHQWADILATNPEFAPSVEPGICRVADGLATPLDRHRQHRLRAIGNGVVALQAATAFIKLFWRMKNDFRR